MPYWRTYYHVIWATRDREPLITEAMHDPLERSIRAMSQEFRAPLHAIGIMPDHVHVAISISPAFAVSTVVGRIKGSSSHLLNHLNQTLDDAPFAWQKEYGVLTFDERDLPKVIDYIQNQPTRHASNRLSPTMELIEARQPSSEGFVG